ncbi:phosphoadenosine phosphosulfate reductase [Sphingorhabdus lutea]|uniref:Adenosine 5'-phosphosulfate reductase n=1 Tax=Sphingorhabdus lutea TaxID=1913578 RepID=A0A1L3JB62_9SPHN|nr:phosphoadenylyl-sulfate reductase [Sphingorhabdus lutea]APG62358.1 phosphoadenosine phosphosulfate reductase [Sphingorhabdus lutea]
MADAARSIDRLDISAHYLAEDIAQYNEQLNGLSSLDAVQKLNELGLLNGAVTVSSFGAESAVLLHLVGQVRPDLPVFFLDTKKHFAETLEYRDILAKHLDLNLIILEPEEVEVTKRDENGLRWSYDPDGCCDIRKVLPLAKGLLPYRASITGRKGFQSSTRNALKIVEFDNSDAMGRLKINPLANWDKERLDAYFTAHNLPRHPLEAQGYPSIGCSPCTSKVAPGEDPRSGRWKGWDKVECGIHAPTDVQNDADNPANAPSF